MAGTLSTTASQALSHAEQYSMYLLTQLLTVGVGWSYFRHGSASLRVMLVKLDNSAVLLEASGWPTYVDQALSSCD